MATAAAAVLGLWGSHASALSLGRLVVLSALGEPLRAEIDIPDINAEEATSLKTSVASSEAYRTAGMDYNVLMSGLQISLQKRPDGRSYLRISSDRAVNEPYVDLILEASWSSGRIVRDYTMLFDPPNLKPAPAITPTVPQVSSSTPASIAAPMQPVPAPAAASTGTTVRTTPSARPTPARPAGEARQQAAEPVNKRVTVKTGDNASKIAVANKPADVSLDQMLVALLRANPDAFVNGNINRIRAGVIINMPDADQALSIPAREASQIVQAQSKDFSAYRSKLASSAPVSQLTSADRKASGTVQATVEDKKPAATAPDKLTLSKGAVQSQAGEDKIAKERSAKEAAARADELSKNIADLTKLSAASTPAAPAEAASAPMAKAESPQPAASAPEVTAAPVPAATASAPQAAASAAVKRPPVPAPLSTPVAEPSLIDDLLEDPIIPAAAGGLIALLAGLGFYRIRQRRKASQMDSSFLESRLQPDSFFGASGGQRVDTHDGGVSGSSMVYSPSQLDAADDVDPVAEADVYLAYGRDLQAEEILKEALRTHPDRLAIHQKLMEIYAKRRDLRNFEAIANEAHKLTGGEGPDWDRVCELGISVDPDNSLYQPGGQPIAKVEAPADTTADDIDTESSPVTEAASPSPAASAPDLDLDLDFSLDDEPQSAASDSVAGAPSTASMAASVTDMPGLDLNFDLPETPTETQADTNSLEFEAPALPDLPAVTESEAPKTASAPTADAGMLEFDLGSLSLDLGAPSEQAAESTADDPLATKLALAEEFNAIGDTDGARALIEEIIAEATGDMKVKAQAALDKLS